MSSTFPITLAATTRCTTKPIKATLDRLVEALEFIENDVGSLVEMEGTKGRIYVFPTYTTAVTMKLVYPDSWGYLNGRYSSLGGRHGTDGADSFVLATHILRAAWYGDGAPDCQKKHASGKTCEAISLNASQTADPAVAAKWQALQARLAAAMVKAREHGAPACLTRAEAQARHDERRAEMLAQAQGKPVTTVASALTAPGVASSVPPASRVLELPAEVELEVGDDCPESAVDGVPFEDPALRVDQPETRNTDTRPVVKLPEVDAINVAEVLRDLKLGSDSGVCIDVVQEATATGVVTRIRITKALSESTVVQLHRQPAQRSLASTMPAGNRFVDVGSVAQAYRELGPTGGGARKALSRILPQHVVVNLTEAEFAVYRQAFYNITRQAEQVSRALGPGWRFEQVFETNLDGSRGPAVPDEYGDQKTWRAVQA